MSIEKYLPEQDELRKSYDIVSQEVKDDFFDLINRDLDGKVDTLFLENLANKNRTLYDWCIKVSEKQEVAYMYQAGFARAYILMVDGFERKKRVDFQPLPQDITNYELDLTKREPDDSMDDFDRILKDEEEYLMEALNKMRVGLPAASVFHKGFIDAYMIMRKRKNEPQTEPRLQAVLK